MLARRSLTGNTTLDNNLALGEEEVAVRDLWLRLVYLTLEAAGETGPAEPVGIENAAEDESGVQQLVGGVVRAYKEGYSLDSFKLEMSLEDNQFEDPGQSALLSQWMRIIFMTLQLRGES